MHLSKRPCFFRDVNFGEVLFESLDKINIFHSHLDKNNEYHSMAGIHNIVMINNTLYIMKNEILFHSFFTAVSPVFNQ